MQEDKERQRDERMQTQEQKDKIEDKIEDKKEDKRGQNRGKHAACHITAKHLTRTKATQSKQSTKPTQTHTRTPKRAKTPLKREIEPYSSAMHHKQSSKADKRHGAHYQRTRANLRQVRQVLNPAHMPPVDTTAKGTHDTTHIHHISKICLDFAPSCLRKSRGETKSSK